MMPRHEYSYLNRKFIKYKHFPYNIEDPRFRAKHIFLFFVEIWVLTLKYRQTIIPN